MLHSQARTSAAAERFLYNAPMRRALRKISAFLTTVLLATVLTPWFGWEVSAGADAHDQETAMYGGSCGAHDRQEHQRDCGNGESDQHHHGCAAHMLGHLVADLSPVTVLTLPESGAGRLAGPLDAVLAAFPERLYRPPLVRLLA